MSCPCGLTKEEVKDFDKRTGVERVPLVGGKCQNPLANGADGICGKALGAHPHVQGNCSSFIVLRLVFVFSSF
jgi:hypothetical protein